MSSAQKGNVSRLTAFQHGQEEELSDGVWTAFLYLIPKCRHWRSTYRETKNKKASCACTVCTAENIHILVPGGGASSKFVTAERMKGPLDERVRE